MDCIVNLIILLPGPLNSEHRKLFIDHYSSINVKPPLCLFPQYQFCFVFYYHDSTMQPESMKGDTFHWAKVF